MLMRADEFLKNEYQVLQDADRKYPDDYVAITFPARFSGEIVEAPEGQSPVLRPRTLVRTGAIEIRRKQLSTRQAN
jgi:hypothetical protein